MQKIITVAGASGHLGLEIVKALRKQEATVRAIVRPGSNATAVNALKATGAEVVEIHEWTAAALRPACEGAHCVVSALAGMREVIINVQRTLLDAAVAAGVPRFIPSDFSLDFTPFSPGENRNLDWRREFHHYLDAAPIAATSIFNGAFAYLLTGDMPLILFKPRIVLHWGSADHAMAFTTVENTAMYTALAALDEATPRYLRIAGDQKSPREIRAIVAAVTQQKFRLIKAGGSGLLAVMIKIARFFSPGKEELYPAWQGMQYMHNMIDKRADLDHTDNDRYTGINWTSIREVLEVSAPGA